MYLGHSRMAEYLGPNMAEFRHTRVSYSSGKCIAGQTWPNFKQPHLRFCGIWNQSLKRLKCNQPYLMPVLHFNFGPKMAQV